uniref:C-type lectin domain-containing protein n=1 Tax=Mastacembelus armatus TaxID=205130 RepID=A0A7N9AUC1_9TELE
RVVAPMHGQMAGQCFSPSGDQESPLTSRMRAALVCTLHVCSTGPGMTQTATWQNHTSARSPQGHLVSIHSRAEVEFIRNLNYTKTHPIWIGLTRDHGWGWTDKTSVGFFNWATGEPNAAFHPGEVGEENCVEMYDDGRWNDNNYVNHCKWFKTLFIQLVCYLLLDCQST